MSYLYYAWGSGLMCVSIIMGALGKHMFKPYMIVSEDIYALAIDYQIVHALALMIIGVLIDLGKLPQSKRFLIGFLMGIVLFCTTLLIYTFTGTKNWIHITPVGGLTLIVSWGMVCVSVLVQRSKHA